MSPGPAGRAATGVALATALAAPLLAAEAGRWRPVGVTVDGLPVAILSADVDADGRRDLVIVSAGAEWGQIGIEERTSVDDSGVLTEVLTVVPALFDRRRVTVLRGVEGGGFGAAESLELPKSVRGVESAGAEAALWLWTDEGVSELVVDAAAGPRLEPRLDGAPVFAGSEDLLPPLGLATDVDADGSADLLVPREDGIAVHLAAGRELAVEPGSLVPVPLGERLPGDARRYRRGPVRRYPLPVARDLDGDGLPELLFRNHDRGWDSMRIAPNRGGGRFGEAVDPLAGWPEEREDEVVFVGDLDGDGRGEVVTQREPEEEDDSIRGELRAAKEPRFHYTIHPLGEDFLAPRPPERELDLVGYLFGDADDGPLPAAPRDLDADGRPDLVSLRLDFTLFEAARALAASAIELGLRLDVHCQEPDGTFDRRATLESELRLRFEALSIGQLASFAGDFDGDGRSDFLRLGPGREAAIHRGLGDCRFDERPSRRVDLAAPPLDAALVVVRDLDGDGRADLVVTRPDERPGAAGPGAVLDLFLSGER